MIKVYDSYYIHVHGDVESINDNPAYHCHPETYVNAHQIEIITIFTNFTKGDFVRIKLQNNDNCFYISGEEFRKYMEVV